MITIKFAVVINNGNADYLNENNSYNNEFGCWWCTNICGLASY